MSDDTVYQRTIDYLYSFVDYSMQRNFRNAPGKFDLARMQSLVDALGNPERCYPVIHVAGTKGKGSVSALCASALQAAGLCTGLYTSPHLYDFSERMQMDGAPISHEDLVSLVNEMKPVIAVTPEVTWFEITTALAFLFFARKHVDAAVIEVGLGGRLDATNVVHPQVTVITSLSYDHMALLGDTLAKIAAEKAGIIKPAVPVILAPQKDEARQVIAKIAEERGSPLIQIGQDFGFSSLSHTLDGQDLMVWKTGEAPVTLHIPLLGAHQVENAATAYTAMQSANEMGIPVSVDAILRGFSRVFWPGRFEILQRDPPMVVDSAHNRDSALRLRQAVDDYFPERDLVLVFGASEDKDIPGMLAELLPRAQEVVFTQSIHPRAMSPDRLTEQARPYGLKIHSAPSIETALEVARQLVHPKNGLLLVTGSLFIAAGARKVWK